MTPVKHFDPRITTPEMQIAYRYINQLGALGGKILGLIWALATIKVTPLVAVIAGVGFAVYIGYIGFDYFVQYPQIAKAFPGRYRLRLFMRAWPMLVVIVIVSGLMSEGLGWQQIGEYKQHVLALAAFPLLTRLKQCWNGR
ncbi:hypothetical protein RYA95_13820 [Pseudomonas syringae pv. actinidiae]|uniref:hypothetical protein n=1 Tax=Pseudomonas syringae TaxID=317 RepID=UPI00034B4A68|nr:hypothetical protein [Pseudomonas syringae]AYL80371.1 hypothetical protein CN228_10765 [Pseudomonas syringae pv. actinidiae str. Shaanxi_M228]MDU8614187.1 hypothetical protein [Pseudomonas syringae pv. actinidiae]OSN82456.1 hypothetical protein BV352_03121 [Pseudomonas syringae pv. actinidiae]